MTNTEMRIAVAEAMGWKFGKLDDGTLRQFHPIQQRWICLDNDPKAQPEWYAHTLPNYPTSRDSCAEFEATLNEQTQAEKYADILCSVVEAEESKDESWDKAVTPLLMLYCICTATPRQRCEAFLRVKGLWKEGAQ